MRRHAPLAISSAPGPAVALALAVALAACGANTTDVTKKGYRGTPPTGAPITPAEAPPGEWAFVPFPDTTCADGSPTGLGVNRGDGPDLVVFFDGGGACWDYVTCSAGAAIDDDFGAAKFAVERDTYLPGSLLDRSVLPPTLSGATLVFVPYCTGDVHGGDQARTYQAVGGALTTTWRHRGHPNVMAFLERLGATWPAPRKVVVAGSSAGGFGALANYEAFRWYWPDAQGYLVDDSGPPLVGDDLPAWQRDAWYVSWRLGASLDLFCVACRDDMSAGMAELSRRHRGDRLALLSHLRDSTMSAFLGGKTGFEFEQALGRLDREVFAPTPNARTFLSAGAAHMLLPAVASESAGAVSLGAWLEQMVSDDPGWASVRDP